MKKNIQVLCALFLMLGITSAQAVLFPTGEEGWESRKRAKTKSSAEQTETQTPLFDDLCNELFGTGTPTLECGEDQKTTSPTNPETQGLGCEESLENISPTTTEEERHYPAQLSSDDVEAIVEMMKADKQEQGAIIKFLRSTLKRGVTSKKSYIPAGLPVSHTIERDPVTKSVIGFALHYIDPSSFPLRGEVLFITVEEAQAGYHQETFLRLLAQATQAALTQGAEYVTMRAKPPTGQNAWRHTCYQRIGYELRAQQPYPGKVTELVWTRR